ncbi:TIGR04222 domain-containing membrane protein [Streptomyces sp. NPDC057445]|uniref:TIGR04222 domain-containing membrane protein n=1 Tax=Streptomyces sp. NPDC057445 TaxID=3346136 RepID=UPI003678EED7
MFWLPLLLLAWAATAISCVRLCLATVAAADDKTGDRAGDGVPGFRRQAHGHEHGHDHAPDAHHELSLYEAAFLAGGPHRVAELTLVSMHRGRRLLLAHTGWTTVVDPEGTDDLERSVIRAAGPAGRSLTAAIRHATAADEAVRVLADRLVTAGLAVSDTARTGMVHALRAVWAAAGLTVALAAAALLILPQHESPPEHLAAWFALPLILTLSCLGIARFELHPYTRWASPAGRRLLRALAPGPADGRERALLAAFAVRGVRALADPALRSALGDRRMTHRGH